VTPPGYLVLSLVMGGAGAAALPAQTASTVGSFLARVRAGTEKYRDLQAAVADGYRPIGPEAPAMGRHWVQPGLLVATRFDPDHPPLLEYASIRGRAVLVGVAYALPLGKDESPPDFPAGRTAWHSHTGGLAEEGLRLTHEDAHAMHRGERVAVLHVWVWLDNPAGPFAPLNWSLPYVRAGLEPRSATDETAKALSLGDGGAGFWESALTRALDATPAEADAVHRVLAVYSDTVAAWRARRPAAPALADDEAAWLDALWGRARAAVRGALGAEARNRLVMLAGF
jgi:hypothetical protein